MSTLDEYDDGTKTIDNPSNLSEANRNKLADLENRFEERLNELEAENRELRRELAELKDGGEF